MKNVITQINELNLHRTQPATLQRVREDRTTGIRGRGMPSSGSWDTILSYGCSVSVAETRGVMKRKYSYNLFSHIVKCNRWKRYLVV